MFVAGIILIVVGILAFIFEAFVIGFIAMILGIIFTIIGAVKMGTRSHRGNNSYSWQFLRGKPLTCYCPWCKKPIESRIENFRIHRKYPDGYVRCPHCGKPVGLPYFHAWEGIPQQQSVPYSVQQQNPGAGVPMWQNPGAAQNPGVGAPMWQNPGGAENPGVGTAMWQESGAAENPGAGAPMDQMKESAFCDDISQKSPAYEQKDEL